MTSLKVGFAAYGMGLGVYVAHKLIYRRYPTYFSRNEITTLCGINGLFEFVVWMLYDKIFANNKEMLENQRFKQLILKATIYYSAETILSRTRYQNYSKYLIASYFVFKAYVVLTKMKMKLKIETANDAMFIQAVPLCIAFGLATIQLFKQ